MKVGDRVRLLKELPPAVPMGAIGQITDVDPLPTQAGLEPLIKVRFGDYQPPRIMSGLVQPVLTHD
jgi:hypothetical protein